MKNCDFQTGGLLCFGFGGQYDWLRGFPGLLTDTDTFYFLVFLFFHFLVVVSMRYRVKLTHVGFWAHVKIASRIVCMSLIGVDLAGNWQDAGAATASTALGCDGRRDRPAWHTTVRAASARHADTAPGVRLFWPSSSTRLHRAVPMRHPTVSPTRVAGRCFLFHFATNTLFY